MSRRLKGSHWSDLAHIYAVSAAGYVPEVFGQPFTPAFVRDLLLEHRARVLIYDPMFDGPAVDMPNPLGLPTLASLPVSVYETAEQVKIPDVTSADEVAMIFHTSGTTSGRPKPVPQSHRWLIAEAEVSWKAVVQAKFQPGEQMVLNNIGSFASIGAASCKLIALSLHYTS